MALLLRLRPDLAFPIPTDIGTLASRAGQYNSLALALDRLDQFRLATLTAAAILGDPVDPQAVAELVGRPVAGALEDFWDQALIWGPRGGRHLTRGLWDLLVPGTDGPRLADLHAEVARYAADPGSLVALLADAPGEAREAVEMLASGSVVGALPDARREVPQTPRTAVEWLIQRRILVAVADDAAALPAEVAAILRAPDPSRAVQPVLGLDPPIPAVPVNWSTTQATGAASALAFVDQLADAGRAWGDQPPSVLRSDGLAVRDLANLAKALELTVDQARVVLEVGGQAGLLGTTGGSGRSADHLYLPTHDFDRWLGADTADRWAVLALAWLRMPRRAHAVSGERKTPNVLSHELLDHHAPELRRRVLELIGAADAQMTLEQATELVHWHEPRRRDPYRHAAIQAVITGAEQLGVMAHGALTGAGRALLEVPEPAAPHNVNEYLRMRDVARRVGLATLLEQVPTVAAALREALPDPVTSVILQADLTIVVPGPPAPELAKFLRAVADPESQGIARVMRVSEASVRRALDQGYTEAKLRKDLGAWSATPVPQPLEFLIGEVARKYADLRAGSAGSYLRSDDEAALARIVRDPKVAGLGLASLAPTVLVSSAPRSELLAGLARAGYAAVAEGSDGKVSRTRPARRSRTSLAQSGTSLAWLRRPAAEELARIAESLTSRSAANPDGVGEVAGSYPRRRAWESGDRRAEPGIPDASIVEIRWQVDHAIQTGQDLWLSYAQPDGSTKSLLVRPIAVDSGILVATVVPGGEVTNLHVARIAGTLPA